MQELLSRLQLDCLITTVGDVMVDQWLYGKSYRETEEYGKPFSICDIKKETISCGGAANVARHIKSLGAESVLIGIVGEDAWGRNFSSLCAQSNIYPYLYHDPSRVTTIKTRVIDESENHYTRFDRECREPLSDLTSEVVKRKIKDTTQGTDVFVVSDYGKGVITEEIIRELVISGKHVLVDLKYHILGKYDGVGLIKPNATDLDFNEVLHLSSIAPTMRTVGSNGIEFWREGELIDAQTSWKIPFKDAVGAGDAVMAGLAVAIASGLSLKEAMRVGNLAGAVSVMEEGTLMGITLEKMEKVCENFNYRP